MLASAVNLIPEPGRRGSGIEGSHMSDASVEELQVADTRLARSFFGAVTSWGLSFCLNMFLVPSHRTSVALMAAVAGVFVLQIGFYVWYAISAGSAARLLGARRWHYVVWILLAPFLALLPIPIVSTIIAVSPLSIRFLLGGQLQTAMREAAFAQLHGG
jgi:hypothetical protein